MRPYTSFLNVIIFLQCIQTTKNPLINFYRYFLSTFLYISQKQDLKLTSLQCTHTHRNVQVYPQTSRVGASIVRVLTWLRADNKDNSLPRHCCCVIRLSSCRDISSNNTRRPARVCDHVVKIGRVQENTEMVNLSWDRCVGIFTIGAQTIDG